MTQLELLPDKRRMPHAYALLGFPPGMPLLDRIKATEKGGNPHMGFHNPDVGGSDGNLIDRFPEGTPFTIKKAETVRANTEYGEGDMVIVTVDTPDGEQRLSIWGAYLVAQVADADPGDFPARVTVKRGPVEGFSTRPDTKRFARIDG